ncbi:MAG: PIN domain-containing protein [Pseudonocardia sp.]
MIISGAVLDAGAFIALERADPTMRMLVDRIRRESPPLVTSAGVVAQVWRGGARRQVELAFLLRRTEVVDLTDSQARVVGTLLGVTGTSDPVDAHIALIARTRGWPVLTSDPDDLRTLDPQLTVFTI